MPAGVFYRKALTVGTSSQWSHRDTLGVELVAAAAVCLGKAGSVADFGAGRCLAGEVLGEMWLEAYAKNLVDENLMCVMRLGSLIFASQVDLEVADMSYLKVRWSCCLVEMASARIEGGVEGSHLYEV